MKCFVKNIPGMRAMIRLSVLIVLLAGPGSYSWPAETYTFGVVPQYDQRQLFAIWKPVLDELGKRTGLTFKLAGEPSITAFGKKLLRGDFDFAYMNPYQLLQANASRGYVPLLRDAAPLRGVLVVRGDDPINSPAELDGKVVAFPSPNAFGASLLLRADLSRLHRVKVVPLYVVSHNSVFLHVAKGLAAAGGGVEKTLETQAAPLKEALRILYASRATPAHPVAVHPKVPAAHAEKTRRAFLELEATPEGRELLSRIPMHHPVAASLDDYAPLRSWGLEAFWVEE